MVGPGIEFRWGGIFRTVQTGSGAHPSSCTVGSGSVFRVVALTTQPHLALKDTVELYLCSPCGLSWPVTGWTYVYGHIGKETYDNGLKPTEVSAKVKVKF